MSNMKARASSHSTFEINSYNSILLGLVVKQSLYEKHEAQDNMNKTRLILIVKRVYNKLHDHKTHNRFIYGSINNKISYS